MIGRGAESLVFWIFVAIGLGLVAWYGWHKRQERRSKLRLLAVQLGLGYSAWDIFGLMTEPFDLFFRGDGRRFENVLYGTWQGVDIKEFDYSYYEKSEGSQGGGKTWHHFSCVLLETDLSCPHLTIAPESFWTRLADGVGLRDIELELEEFNRAFNVRCNDRRFAVAVLDARMMRWLLEAGPGWSFELMGDSILCFSKRREPFELIPLLGSAKRFHESIPRVVRELYGPTPAG